MPEADALRAAAYDHQVKRIILLSLAAIVPGLGLVLAPVVAVLMACVIRRAGSDPAFTALRGAWATLVIALVTTACNWIGLGLIALSFIAVG